MLNFKTQSPYGQYNITRSLDSRRLKYNGIWQEAFIFVNLQMRETPSKSKLSQNLILPLNQPTSSP